MAKYVQSPVPQTGQPVLERYLAQELGRIQMALTTAQTVLEHWSQPVAWPNPEDGRIAVFDGDDPGSGEGIYYYRGGSWYKLTESAGTFTFP